MIQNINFYAFLVNKFDNKTDKYINNILFIF